MISQHELLNQLSQRIPEARREFMLLPDRTNTADTLGKFFEVTERLITHCKFQSVKQCLQTADSLLKEGDYSICFAMRTVYIHRLAALLYKQGVLSELVYFLMPMGVRLEFSRTTFFDK